MRGGFPESLLARDDKASLRWRLDFIRSYLERDVPMFAPRMPAPTIGRLWTMLANGQGSLLNQARLASGLGVSAPAVGRYIDLSIDLQLVRRLPPWSSNLGKRLVRSPKIYVRDSGILHALLEIETWNDLIGHPVVGASWEGFVIENLIAAAAERWTPDFIAPRRAPRSTSCWSGARPARHGRRGQARLRPRGREGLPPGGGGSRGEEKLRGLSGAGAVFPGR